MYENAILHFQKTDPFLYAITPHTEPVRLTKKENLFLELCDHIISQQLSIKASASIFLRFSNLFPQNKITPDILLTLPNEHIRQAGLSYSKVAYLKDLAQKIQDKTVHLNILDSLPDEKVIEELIKIKGIGRWTAEMFLMTALAREDVFSYGDLGLRKAIQKLYGFKKEPTQKQAEKIAKKWSPYKTYACKILWKSLAV